MKCKTVCLVLLIMITFTSSAFATNWVYVSHEPGMHIYIPPYNMYIDADSVRKTGNTLFFWSLQIYDKPTMLNVKKDMTKFEVTMTKPESRTVDGYHYDSNNFESRFSQKYFTGIFIPFSEDTIMGKAYSAALKYAMESAENIDKPTPK